MNKNHFLNKAALLLIVLLILGTIPVMIAGDESTHEVKFYTCVEEWELYETQYIESGNELSTPLSPALPLGMVSFLGWSKQEDGLEDLYDFSEPVTEDFVLYAQFSNKYLISFKNAHGDIFETKLVEKGKSVPSPSEKPPSGNTSLFMYWAVGDTEDFFDLSTPVYSNIVLRPIYGDSHYVYFNSTKGTPVEKQLVSNNAQAEPPENPTKAGYDFKFWSTNQSAKPTDTAEKYNFATPVTSSLTLYAVWNASTGNNRPDVKVILWKEKENLPLNFDKSDPANYVYHDSYIKKEFAGKENATVTESEVDGNLSKTTSKKLPEYSTFYRASNTTIAGDGSSAINVYYTYNIYTIYFNLNGANSKLTASEPNIRTVLIKRNNIPSKPNTI